MNIIVSYPLMNEYQKIDNLVMSFMTSRLNNCNFVSVASSSFGFRDLEFEVDDEVESEVLDDMECDLRQLLDCAELRLYQE